MPVILDHRPITVLRRPLRMILAALLFDQLVVLRNRDGEYCVLCQVASFTRPELALLYAKSIEFSMLSDVESMTSEG